VLVTQAFARLAFGEGEHLGRLLEDADGDMYRIVGVVDPFYNPCGWPIQEYAAFFMSHAASYAGGTAFLVRAEPGRVAEVAKAAEERLMAVNGGRNLKIQTIEDVKALYFGPQRLVTTLMGGVVFLLVLVTSIGIVGLTSFSVTERTRQIGTRRALGARRSDILRHFLLENWLVTSMGLVLGVLAAYGMNVGLVTVASGAKLDLGLVAGGAVLLWAAGLLATLAPALRAARTSPAIATRNV